MTMNTSSPLSVLEVPCQAPELTLFIEECESLAQEALSMEAFSFDDISRVVVERFPRLSATLKDAFRFLTTWDYSKPEVLNYNAVAAVLKRVQYTDLSDVLLSKPVGFAGNLLAYAEELHKVHLPALTGVKDHVLLPTLSAFSNYLSHPEDLQNRRVLPIHEDFDQTRLSAQLKSLQAWFVAGNHAVEAPFGELYQNNRECVETLVKVTHLNETRWKQTPPKEISRITRQLVAVGESLLNQIQDQNLPLSKQVLVSVAGDLALVGRWVEWYAALTTKIIDLTTALKLTEKKLLRAF